MKQFLKTHEWIEVSGDTATLGISDFAQKELSDIVYVELPAIGKQLKAGSAFMVIESVKVASDIYSPADGEITEVNEALNTDPALVNREAENGAWLVKMKITGKLSADLLDKNAYDVFVKTAK
ncbi:MAG: glycine cleavage system protein H [Spirochaetes bacterium GWF1_41_5]|nr:MAG: glycine cleavage system protein H [Spirochaetes bacterium GWF1_41_5]